MKPFKFKHFTIQQEHSALKVGTDAMLLGAISNHKNPNYCLDIGAGTGVIALMLAQKFQNSHIFAIEPNQASYSDCQTNFQLSDWNDRLSAFQTSIQEFETNQQFDLIVTNPPFYENALLSDSHESNLAKHATIGLLEEFFTGAKKRLSEIGLFWIILPIESKEKWMAFALDIGLHIHVEHHIESIPGTFKRCILAFGLEKIDEISIRTLLVRNSDNSYSSEYKELTKEFHFNKL